jgi:hypothetical protein
MTGASEWRRAGLAVSGVTFVLIIAAGIHFFAPPPRNRAEQPVPVDTISAAANPTVVPEKVPVIDEAATDRSRTSAVARRRIPSQGRRTLRAAIAVESPDRSVDAPRFSTPLIASPELLEHGMHFEPMRLSMSAAWIELPLPAVVADVGSAPRVSAHVARRGPVVAAFVTAGSAMAGGFRSAGRAIKRAF